jgi:hypothetical protein
MFGPIEDIMQSLYYQKKGTHVHTMEDFAYTKKLHLTSNDDKYTIFPNLIFYTIIKIGNTLHNPCPHSPTPHPCTFTDLTTPSIPSVGHAHQIYVYIIAAVHLVGITKVSDVKQNALNIKL